MRKTFALLAATAVAIVPATAQVPQQQRATYLNPREVAEAQKQHPEVVAEFGGALTGPRATYAEGVGRRVAAYSGTANAGQVYRFTVLNSAVENAFAVPGGYVYITRQLMSIMNDEAELAFVMGHETGHIAANHAQARRSATANNSILGVLGSILGAVVGNNAFGNLISQSAQQFSKMRLLSFTRDQEYQADALGIRYIASAGYDANASATMLAQLTRSAALEARIQGGSNRSTPEWASTHPLSENRVAQAGQLARQTGRAGTGIRNRDGFLAQIDGITVDDDPEQGIIDGRSFTHPDLRLQFMVPTGFLMQNGTRAVTIQGSGGQAQFSGGRYTGSMENYIAEVLRGLTGGRTQIALGPMQQTSVNGIPATYVVGRANTSGGGVDVGVFAYRWDANTAYHFVTLTRAGQGVQPFASMFSSLRRITPGQAAAIRPRVIDVVTVQRGDTVQSLASRMAYRNFQQERFIAINGLAPNSQLLPGQKVKLVVYGTRRS
ncbi:M48 family metalloprotease [Sphingomonas xanthus]|uniref:M48 family metalloprotease n=1 Tax=Sphingomonas xanthus TaxID=2594473 RepID=A0A516ITB5_9SPHN|nr:M48 family metalloprotease [Sphingomonas xanthus]QDP20125.1 M48 family metalloprotease [Sphingomonas xanthus]